MANLAKRTADSELFTDPLPASRLQEYREEIGFIITGCTFLILSAIIMASHEKAARRRNPRSRP